MQNILDRCIGYVAPQTALKREVARQKMNILNSGYDESAASRKKNSMAGWLASSKSPQEDIDKNQPLMRQRSRSLYMTSSIAAAAIKTTRTNVVGTGLKLQPSIDADYLNMSPEDAMRWNKAAQREFKMWSESKLCDITRLHDFYEMQALVQLSAIMSGDAGFMLMYEDKKDSSYMPYGLRVRLIESDRISTPDSLGTNVDLWKTNMDNGNRIYNGVEIDGNGAVAAYHVCNMHPNSTLSYDKKWQRVEAWNEKTGLPNMALVYESERIEQYRGVPLLAPVIESLKQLTRYTDSEVMAAVLSSFFTLFITSNDDKGDRDFTGLGSMEEDEDDRRNLAMGAGAINILKPGESIQEADPSRPNSNFDGFVSSFTKFIGAALEIPDELLLKRFGNSYSAARGELEEAWKAFKMKRSWLVKDFCQPVYEIFLYEAVAEGRIKAPGFFLDAGIRKAYSTATWIGPTKGMLDPVKEVTASTIKIDNGLSTREIESYELSNGDSDFESNMLRLKRENQKFSEAREPLEQGKEKADVKKN